MQKDVRALQVEVKDAVVVLQEERPTVSSRRDRERHPMFAHL